MKKIKYILFGLLFLFLFNNNVNAIENYSSDYNLTISETTQFTDNSYTINGDTLTYQDIIDELISLNSDYYNIFIYSSFYNNPISSSAYNNSLNVALIPKIYDSLSVSVYGYGDILRLYSNSTSSYSFYTLSLWSENTFSITYDNLKNCYLYNSNCNNNVNPFNLSIGRSSDGNFNNSSSYYMNVPPTNISGDAWFVNYPIYSSIPIYLYNTYNFSDSSIFYKTLFINNKMIDIGDELPTYYDLLSDISNSSLNLQRLDDIFISNVPKDNLSSLRVDFSFNSVENISDLRFRTYFIGRVNHGSYYTYDFDLDCFGGLSLAFGEFESFLPVYGTLVDSFCRVDLTNYDEIFIRIRPTTWSDISNLSLKTNYGFINTSYAFNGANHYDIMEHFSSLPSNFNILLSTTRNKAYANFKSDSKYTLMSSVYRNDTNRVSSLATNPMSFGNYDNTNALIYNYLPQNNNTTDLYLFFSDDTILSFKDSNNLYTYYDDTNNLVNGFINNTYQVSANSYDLSYYFGIVNDYIDDIKTDILSLSELTQTFFDGLPYFIQIFIIVLHILCLTYALFKVLRS